MPQTVGWLYYASELEGLEFGATTSFASGSRLFCRSTCSSCIDKWRDQMKVATPKRLWAKRGVDWTAGDVTELETFARGIEAALVWM